MKLKRVLKWSAGIILLALVVTAFIAYWTSTKDCGRYAVAPRNPMKAIIHGEYGSPDVVRLEEIEKPVPNDEKFCKRQGVHNVIEHGKNVCR
jgi:hypothetical protein